MPGKHAPPSSKSFYLSVARAAAGALAVLALVVLIAMAAVRSTDDAEPVARETPTPTRSAKATATATATSTAKRTPTPTATATATARALRSKTRIQVLVLNATGRTGLAAGFRQQLLEDGYERVEIGNADPRSRSILYYAGGYRPEAARMLDDFATLNRIRGEPGDLQGNAKLTVVLGSDYDAG